MIYVIVGKSSTGKDTIMQEVIGLTDIVKPLVSHTSRPRRVNERNHKEYHFVSKEEMQLMIENNEFIETRKYDVFNNGIKDTWYYGLHKDEVQVGKDYIVIVDLNGLDDLIKYFGDECITSFYITCCDELRYNRSCKREKLSNLTEEEQSKKLMEIERRILADNSDFSSDKTKGKFDYTYRNETIQDFNDVINAILEVISLGKYSK